MNSFQLDNKDIGKLLQPLQYIDRVDIRALRPSRNASNTMNEMELFLNKHHQSGHTIGFEMNHENDRTTFNFISDTVKSEQTRQRFITFNEESGRMENVETKMLEIESGKYMTVIDFQLNKDMYHPIATHNNIEGRDPLDEILNEMAGQSHNISYKYQVIAQPIADSKWKQRRPLPILITTILQAEWNGMKRTLNGMLDYIKALTFNSDGSTLDQFKSGIINTFGGPFDMVTAPLLLRNGISIDEYAELFVDDDTLADAVKNKGNSKGYLTKIRLIALGEDETQLLDYTNEVVSTVEEVYRTQNTEINTNQQLVGIQQNNNAWMTTEGAKIVGRHTDIDFNNRITDTESYASLRLQRRRPTVLTPHELAGLMHFIQDSTQPGIQYE